MKKILKFFTFLALVLGLVSCSSEPVGITISSANNVRVIKEHETLQLEAKVYPEKANQEVLWSSSDENVATVNDNGLVTGVDEGNVNIIATLKENETITQKFALIVVYGSAETIAVESVTINNPTNVTSFKAGEKLNLTATVLPKEASQSIVWSTSDEKIAKVNRGEVRGLKEGKVTITAASKNFATVKDTIELTIEKNDDPIYTKDWANMGYATHDDYLNKENGTPLKVKGKVTNVSYADEGETVSYFIQHGLDGYYV